MLIVHHMVGFTCLDLQPNRVAGDILELFVLSIFALCITTFRKVCKHAPQLFSYGFVYVNLERSPQHTVNQSVKRDILTITIVLCFYPVEYL